MNRNTNRIALGTALAIFLVVLAGGALLPSHYEHYLIGKIDFIIWDNQHANVGSLSQEQFVSYLQQCGARTDSSASRWTVQYNGLFDHKSWAFSFVAPSTKTQ